PRAKDALSELRSIAGLPQGHLFTGNPLYEELCALLANINGGLDVDTGFSIQQRINDLNTIGHVFTRTRKREVQDHFPARRAAVIRVDLSDREMAFYEAVTEFVREQAGGYANFATIMPQRQVASSIPAAREYLQE